MTNNNLQKCEQFTVPISDYKEIEKRQENREQSSSWEDTKKKLFNRINYKNKNKLISI